MSSPDNGIVFPKFVGKLSKQHKPAQGSQQLVDRRPPDRPVLPYLKLSAVCFRPTLYATADNSSSNVEQP